MYIGRHVKYRYCCQILMKIEFSRKYSNIEFRENQSGESRVVPCRRTDRQRDKQRGMTKLIVAARNFENAPKNREAVVLHVCFGGPQNSQPSATLCFLPNVSHFPSTSQFLLCARQSRLVVKRCPSPNSQDTHYATTCYM
jgi:hypothetical protein